MHTDARKLQLIEAVLRTENEDVLQVLENLVATELNESRSPKGTFTSSLGLLSKEEAEAMKQVIQENFEKVNPDDWK